MSEIKCLKLKQHTLYLVFQLFFLNKIRDALVHPKLERKSYNQFIQEFRQPFWVSSFKTCMIKQVRKNINPLINRGVRCMPFTNFECTINSALKINDEYTILSNHRITDVRTGRQVQIKLLTSAIVQSSSRYEKRMCKRTLN